MITNHSKRKLYNSDLELEAIQKFRTLNPFLPTLCRIFRIVKETSSILCIDFTDCATEIPGDPTELIFLIALSSHSLGLADYLIFTVNNQIFASTINSEFKID